MNLIGIKRQSISVVSVVFHVHPGKCCAVCDRGLQRYSNLRFRIPRGGCLALHIHKRKALAAYECNSKQHRPSSKTKPTFAIR